MAILVKKDVGYGEIVSNVYVKLTPYFTPLNGGEWKIQAVVFLSKRAKEINVLKKWINHRANTVRVPVPFDPEVSKNLSIPEATWSGFADRGPWDSAAELEHIVRTYMNVSCEPIQKYEGYYYNAEQAKGFENITHLEGMSQIIYTGVKDANAQLVSLIESPQLSKADTVNSIEDDLESDVNVISRIIQSDTAIGKLAPGEETLTIPTIWEHGWG